MNHKPNFNVVHFTRFFRIPVNDTHYMNNVFLKSGLTLGEVLYLSCATLIPLPKYRRFIASQ